MKTEFRKLPLLNMPEELEALKGWDAICRRLQNELVEIKKNRKIIVIDCYHGVDDEELFNELIQALSPAFVLSSKQAMKTEPEIREMVYPDVTDDRIFGRLTQLQLQDYFDPEKISAYQKEMDKVQEGILLVWGIGSAIVQPQSDILIYADMARWEIQLRMRKKQVDSIGQTNREIEYSHLYKQGYFVDWRVCNSHKRNIMPRWSFVLDTNTHSKPKMVSSATYFQALTFAGKRPFSVVPFFDPGPWGGHWMQKKFNLDPEQPNFAWCFNCVPEENSLLLAFGDVIFEIPSINLVFYSPEVLLGKRVYERFGAEFPIRFDFLDTMGGGNLSLQVHPTKEYIKAHFNMAYTQDESYYILDAGENAVVYLGIKNATEPEKMINALTAAQEEGIPFEADEFVPSWPVKKHDHVLIPAGTVHCSGKDSMVLEISATPYIFTFKLWDWGRLGMDGKPRPINIAHGKKVIDWSRREQWTKDNLINNVEVVRKTEEVTEERTGLHPLEFIETRRHWFTKPVRHHTRNNLNVVCLVEGQQIIIESPTGNFEPFTVNYAETFIVPAAVGAYTIRPYGPSVGEKVATLKAYVRE